MNLEKYKLHTKHTESVEHLRGVLDRSTLTMDDRIRVYNKVMTELVNNDIKELNDDTPMMKTLKLFGWVCSYYKIEAEFNSTFNGLETDKLTLVETTVRRVLYYKDNILFIPSRYKEFLTEYLTSGLPLNVLNSRIRYVLKLSRVDLYMLSYVYTLNGTSNAISYNNIITNIRDVDNVLKIVNDLFKMYVDDSIADILAAAALRNVLLDNTYKLEEIPRLALERLPEVMDNALVDRRRLVNDLCKGLK